MYQNIYSIGSEQSNYVFILSGDHIYKMDYGRCWSSTWRCRGGCDRGDDRSGCRRGGRKFGVIETDEKWRIIGFEEKPAQPKRSRIHPGKINASMGVYIFNTQLLVPILIADAEDPAFFA